MKTLYTPAPWVFEESTRTIRSKPGNYWVASIDSWEGAINHEANACLIATAPELLNALTTAEDFMSGFEGDAAQEGMDKKLAQIRTVIAKARGQS
ncbi:MAG: hypothetical protein B7Y56_03480 [Gallionellales bacterium 35-53-114]|jgi:hypothetical protein|nr:MAG: hypothetical protein B7Y56_03480 [Gallionellales bacterium 35-53-114]OYZ65167.1 MAG: hypothetical protein B7Y04_00640 [Gallionellales bacterium 24-53-125]OZB08074.1 MAG: hypothetical protein B7X61_11090 [Gallionellales bacterium 39-52-133]HQS59979.1 hypothetical protein [Gallionellaceae bacterium]HQS76639.1 hypothetical protein [Gallionellaceae bacterium]